MRLVILHDLQSENVLLYSFLEVMSLLWVMRVLSRVMIAAVSSILLWNQKYNGVPVKD